MIKTLGLSLGLCLVVLLVIIAIFGPISVGVSLIIGGVCGLGSSMFAINMGWLD